MLSRFSRATRVLRPRARPRRDVRSICIRAPLVSDGEGGMILGFDHRIGPVHYLVPVGTKLDEYDVCGVIETDKAAIEIKCPFKGVVVAHHVEPGTEISENEPVLEIAHAEQPLQQSSP